MSKDELIATHCIPRKGAADALHSDRQTELAALIPDWEVDSAKGELRRAFKFRDFHHTMGFVNAVAWMANREDHHPDLEVGYNYCRMRWSTHDVGGLSLNDFLCAAKVDAIAS
jgi:4a-hydroxytetrahydrobiopterin dehydratase